MFSDGPHGKGMSLHKDGITWYHVTEKYWQYGEVLSSLG